MRGIAIVLLALALQPAPALAYSPNVGDRAADIVGWDAVSEKTVRLSDYAGRWTSAWMPKRTPKMT
jgi:hypothetical protein